VAGGVASNVNATPSALTDHRVPLIQVLASELVDAVDALVAASNSSAPTLSPLACGHCWLSLTRPK